MKERYEVSADGGIRALGPDELTNRPWFVSLTAAAVHSGVPVTCFTKEGIRSRPFPNPLPDPDEATPDAFPVRRHYFVQMIEGVIHSPPMTPEEAACWVPYDQPGIETTFAYEPQNIVPEF